MRRRALLRTAAIALIFYGILGLFVAAAMALVGYVTFSELDRLRTALDGERGALVSTLRTVASTLGSSASATTGFESSIEGGRGSADTGSRLAFETSVSFRQLAQGLDVQVLGVQPFAGLAPQFVQSADQLEQLAIALGTTRDSLAQNQRDVAQVGRNLEALQTQVATAADALDRALGLMSTRQQLLPFQVAFYGVCLLFALQSVFSFIAGWALAREARIRGEAHTHAVHTRPPQRMHTPA